MNVEEFLDRLLELVKDDEELHAATVRLISAEANAKEELAKMRKRRYMIDEMSKATCLK